MLVFCHYTVYIQRHAISNKRKLHWLYVQMYLETWKYMFLRRSLASLARAYKFFQFFFCRYIWGSCPPNTKKLATLVRKRAVKAPIAKNIPITQFCKRVCRTHRPVTNVKVSRDETEGCPSWKFGFTWAASEMWCASQQWIFFFSLLTKKISPSNCTKMYKTPELLGAPPPGLHPLWARSRKRSLTIDIPII